MRTIIFQGLKLGAGKIDSVLVGREASVEPNALNGKRRILAGGSFDGEFV